MSATHDADRPGPGIPTAQAREPTNELTDAQQQQLVLALIKSLAGDAAVPRHVETHISHVLLHGGYAFKIKKALSTTFLDQSTLARRRAACAEELRLNRRLAPQMYLDVVPITGTLDAPALGGSGPLLEVAVKMRAFDEGGLWDRLAARDELHTDDIDDLATVLAHFHADAAVADSGTWLGTSAQVRAALLDSLRDLQERRPDAAWPDAIDRRALARLLLWEAETFPHLEAVMSRRLAAGRVREGHGDLHLGNVAREAGHSLVFDGIEFDPALRWLDVMSDVAFMTMDLHAHGLPALASRFVDAYLQRGGDYDGMRVFGYYLVHRALVRAKVALVRASQAAGPLHDEARAAAHRYLALASRLAAPRRRALLITHGLSGSGKTTLTQGLLELIGAPRVRADVERKRLAGLSPLQRSHSPPADGLYGAAMNDANLARILDAAKAVLEGGWPVIVDATFLRRPDRDAARGIAGEAGVPFVILQFNAPLVLLRERVRQRAKLAQDASEANEDVLSMQIQTQVPLQADERDQVYEVQESAHRDPPPRADWTALLKRLGLAGDANAP